MLKKAQEEPGTGETGWLALGVLLLFSPILQTEMAVKQEGEQQGRLTCCLDHRELLPHSLFPPYVQLA